MQMMVTDKQVMRVLLVEDDDIQSELVESYLTEDESCNYMIHGVNTLAEVRQLFSEVAKQPNFDVILLDLNLPDSQGNETLQACRAYAKTIPVVVLTGLMDDKNEIEAMELGAQEYLLKGSYTRLELLRAIKHAAHRNKHLLQIETEIDEICEQIAKNNKNANTVDAILNGKIEVLLSEEEFYDEDDGGESLAISNTLISFKRLVSELNQMNKNLQYKNREIYNFYHSLSHELKTPLTSIYDFSGILLDGLGGELTDLQQEYISIIKNSCEQMTLYIDDLFDLSRIDTGKLSIKRKAVDMSSIVNETIVSFSHVASNKGLTLESSVEKNLPLVYADLARIKQVLINLVKNAIKFTDNGQVTVLVNTKKDSYIEVSVKDTGCGISAENHERIFDRLYQVKRDDDFGSSLGMGIGLSLCNEILTLHETKMKLASEVGKGSNFSFLLPIYQHEKL